MPKDAPDYLSYLLRLWCNDGGTQSNWRASLDSSLTGERHSFASLDELFVFLRRQTGAKCDASGDEGVTKAQHEAHQRPPTTQE